QDLEYMGLLESPHTSAGRVPTQQGLRLFVDALLEVDPVTAADRERLEATRQTNERDVPALLDRVGNALSSITRGASLVLTPKHEAPI
ncbi:MAG: heat-inducible transcriptional repressor HrcA, partial [Pararhodobacter sp.]